MDRLDRPQAHADRSSEVPSTGKFLELGRRTRQLVSAMLTGAALLAPALGDEAPTQKKTTQETHESVDLSQHSFEKLIELFNDNTFLPRQRAQEEIVRRVDLELDKHGAPYKDAGIFEEKPEHSPEQKQRLRIISWYIYQREISIDMPKASIFHAPDDWNEESKTVPMSEALRTIGGKTGQPICIADTPLSLLGAQVPTKGFDGLCFWDALHKLRGSSQEEVMVNANNFGALHVFPADKDTFKSVSGSMCGFVHMVDNYPHHASFTYQIEPKFMPLGWKVLSINAKKADGTEAAILSYTKSGKDIGPMDIEFESASAPGEEVTLTVNAIIYAMPMKTYEVTDKQKPQEFIAPRGDGKGMFSLNYLSTEKTNDQAGCLIRFKLTPPELHSEISSKIGFSFVREDGALSSSIEEITPNSFDNSWGWRVITEPEHIKVHLPEFVKASTQVTFTFEHIPLSTKPRVK